MNDVNRKLQGALTTREVMECLELMPPDALVIFKCNYGDRSRTEQALPVTDVELLDKEISEIQESAYSESGLAIQEVETDDGEERENPKDSYPEIVVLC